MFVSVIIKEDFKMTTLKMLEYKGKQITQRIITGCYAEEQTRMRRKFSKMGGGVIKYNTMHR